LCNFLPANYSQYPDVESQVEYHDSQDREDNGPGDDATRIAHLSSHVRCRIITQVIINAYEQARAQSSKKAAIKGEGIGRVGESQGRVEMGECRDNHSAD